MEALGVTLVAPESVTRAPSISVPARVVVPPGSDRILGSPLGGLVTDLAVSAGQSVEEGQVLARLQSSELLAQQRAWLEAGIADRLAAQDEARDQRLFEAGVIAGRRLQESRARRAETAARLAEQGRLLELAGMARAQVAALSGPAGLSGTLELRAPLSGVVAEQRVSVGERVEAMTPIYRITRRSEIWVEARVPQARLADVSVGDRLNVTDHDHVAIVTDIGQSVDPGDQTVLVRARLDELPADVLPGQFVTTQLDVRSAGSFAVPAAAVTRSAGRSWVFVRNAEGFEVRPVNVAGRDAQRVIIAGGLSPEDRLAVTGIAALKAAWQGEGE